MNWYKKAQNFYGTDYNPSNDPTTDRLLFEQEGYGDLHNNPQKKELSEEEKLELQTELNDAVDQAQRWKKKLMILKTDPMKFYSLADIMIRGKGIIEENIRSSQETLKSYEKEIAKLKRQLGL